MKKEIIFPLITTLITVVFIVASLLQNTENSCKEELTSLHFEIIKMDIKTNFFFNFFSDTSNRQGFDSLVLFKLFEMNSSINISETASRFNERSELMSKSMGLSATMINKSKHLREKAEDKLAICNRWSLASNIVLYFGLILSLLSLYYCNEMK